MASLVLASPCARGRHITSPWELPSIQWAEHHLGGFCPIPIGFLAITLDRAGWWWYRLFHCVLHGIAHRLIYNTMVLFENTEILKIPVSITRTGRETVQRGVQPEGKGIVLLLQLKDPCSNPSLKMRRMLKTHEDPWPSLQIGAVSKFERWELALAWAAGTEERYPTRIFHSPPCP